MTNQREVKDKKKRKRSRSSEGQAKKREVKISHDTMVSTLGDASLPPASSLCSDRRGNNEEHFRNRLRKLKHAGRVDTEQQARFAGPPIGPKNRPKNMPRRKNM